MEICLNQLYDAEVRKSQGVIAKTWQNLQEKSEKLYYERTYREFRERWQNYKTTERRD
jgi:hypothetical protein